MRATGKNRLVKSACGSNYVDYTYDRYGRVITETRHVDSGDEVAFKYAYNSKNQLESKTYPGNLVVTYSYDAYGNHIQTDACGKTLYKSVSYDGLANVSSSMDRFTTTTKLNNKGFMDEILLSDGTDKLESLKLSYDAKTGNLLSRQRNGNLAENFSYDSIDRLTGVTSDGQSEKVFSYDKKGNLTYKTGIGKCYYNIEGLPHALSSVEDSAKIMPTTGYELNYNDINRIDNIIRHNGEMLRMSFSYGPDCQRWSSVIANGMQRLGTIYAGDYEKTVAGRSAMREFFYIGDNVMIERRNGGDFVPYIVFTDNLGSILSAYDENGNNVFDADYDVWGNQSLRNNQIGLRRGYCGHEIISEFNLINMNGRLYDPTTSRFLSPDNYVQLPENSQSYNRYSYCLNNPLKYTDPSGELFGLDDALVLGIASGAFFGAMDACMNGNSMIKGSLIGAAKGLASYGIGEAFGHGVGSFGKEMLRAGSHGLASGVISAIDGHNFMSGFGAGFVSSMSSSGLQTLGVNKNSLLSLVSPLTGGLTALATGDKFMYGASIGMNVGAYNHGWMKNSKGEQVYELDEVVVIGKEKANLILQIGELNDNLDITFKTINDKSSKESILYNAFNACIDNKLKFPTPLLSESEHYTKFLTL